ncbi:MAG: protein kinase [Byssovorax sp.]
MEGESTTSFVRAAPAVLGAGADTDFPRTIGAFRLVRTLGRGGMAVVYFAEHVETGALVAIKTVESGDASLLSGIRREIHALRRVDHPGVVRIVAQGVEGELPWYAMEVVEGRTLRDYHDGLAPGDSPGFARAANGALPQVLTLLRAVCDALSFVHGMGLVHRDLKPENIMIREDGSPVLVDFGLAMQLRGPGGRDVLEVGPRFGGTPAYMAPEQIDGELMDARVDLYALGCILYESVTGRPPFVGTIAEVLSQHERDAPEPPSSRVSEVPPALDELILALLQKRPRDRIGYADEVAAVLVRLGAEDSPPSRRTEPHLYRPRLAGRAGALAVVDNLLKTLRLARGGRVLVSGESGLGKTRFAMEVGISANRRGFTLITGQCVSVSASGGEAETESDSGSELAIDDESSPDSGPGPDSDPGMEVKAAALHPFRHLLSTIADHCREQGLEETERIFGARGPALALHEPSIARLPGQDHYPRLAALPAAAARARLNACLADTFAAFARTRPLVLVLEDLHWADEASMSFLQSLDEAYFAASRVLILGTYRPEETSVELRALLDAEGVTRIDLGRLDRAGVQRMVSDMLSMPEPPPALIQFLVARSEGHPFFVAEYLRTAVQERMLVRNEARAWQVEHPAGSEASAYEALPIPGELRALVIRRVAALGPGALAVARMAAVLGREIATDLLAAAMSLDDTAHLEAVEELRARQIIEIERGRLRFAHDKLRKIIYREIGHDERRRLDAAAGAAIEARHGGAPERSPFYPELVHHFTTARDHEKAFEYLVKAGQAALDATASGEALSFFRRAITLDDARAHRGAARLGPLERADLEARLGQAAFNVGLLPEAERLTRTALQRFRGSAIEPDRGGPRAVVDLVAQLAPHAVHMLRARRPPEVDPRERHRLTGEAAAADRLAEILFFQQKWLRGLTAALGTVNVADRLGVSLELVRGYASLGFGLTTVPLPRLRALYEARAGEAAAALDDPQAIALVAMLTGISATIAGRFREARAAIDVTLARARADQDPRQIAISLALLGLIEEIAGRPEDALLIYDQIGHVGRKSGNRQGELWSLGGRAGVALSRGHAEEAIALFEQRRVLAGGYSDDPTEWIVHGTVAEAHLLTGDHERARRVAEKTLHHIAELRFVAFHFYRGYVANGEVFFALWERATTDGEQAALERSARLLCKKMSRYALLYPLGRPQALRFQGLLDARLGRISRARDAFRESLAAATRLTMPLEEGIAHLELGRHAGRADPARIAHFGEARALFTRLGYTRWLDRLDRLG